jgi:murein DD-endopeptidase MepM/ murein hydrolase activator NlpD
MIESQDRFELNTQEQHSSKTNDISSFFFFTPVKGTVTNVFNSAEKHFGVDIAAAPNEAIKATLDGTVILSAWTSETGYIITIQHSNNLVSVYKHNSALLKKAGTYVKAGEAIAIIGNSGEYTSGPHLHFELWYNGSPVNPKDYIAF